jgi:hypothetical protein
VIGRGGECIHKLQQQAGCHMQVAQGIFLKHTVSRHDPLMAVFGVCCLTEPSHHVHYPSSVLLVALHCTIALRASEDSGAPERLITLSGSMDAIECVHHFTAGCLLISVCVTSFAHLLSFFFAVGSCSRGRKSICDVLEECHARLALPVSNWFEPPYHYSEILIPMNSQSALEGA